MTMLKDRRRSFDYRFYPTGGVYRSPSNNKWVAVLYSKGGVCRNLGYFLTRHEALEEYHRADLQFNLNE